MSLPRFVAKARPPPLCGYVPADYRRAFGHALATNGAFLAHVLLTLAAALAGYRRASLRRNRDAMVPRPTRRQFRHPCRLEHACPALRPTGATRRAALRFALKTLSARCAAPRVPRAFTAIAWDAGYFDALVPPALGSTADYSLPSR